VARSNSEYRATDRSLTWEIDRTAATPNKAIVSIASGEVASVRTLGWLVDLVRWGEPWDIEEDDAG
jgi:hypothetical protein